MTTLKQPKILTFLFLTEMWERFAYFAVLCLLVLYMTKHFNFSDQHAYMIFSTFCSLLFITPIIGGYLADHIIGHIHAVILGAILLAIGYYLLIIMNTHALFIALGVLICGNGFFKPNISTLLGKFYEENDPRREPGFTIFYVGINIGATIGVILCGFIAKYAGWQWAFFTAGSGLLIGLCFFLFSLYFERKSIQQHVTINENAHQKKYIIHIYFFTVITITLMQFFTQHPNLSGILLDVFSISLLFFLVYIAFKENKANRNKLMLCVILIIFSIAFWSLYQQTPMSLMLYIDRDVNRHLFGITFPTSTINCFNGIFLILFSPFMIKLWKFLNMRNINISFTTKFALGILFMGFGFFMLFLSAHTVTLGHKSSLGWIALSYALQTLGELCLSPVGLAMITVLAPEKLRGMMMGVWFFSLAAATAIAGQLAKLASLTGKSISMLSSALKYGHAFEIYAISAISIAIILFLIMPILDRLQTCIE